MKIDNETRYVPSRTICLKFAGQALPRFIYLFNCRYSIYPFIPKTKICFSCFRVGHLSKACKSRPRCLYCGEAAHDSSEECAHKQSSSIRINCSGDHLATSHDCLKVTTHKMALSLAATENISLTEALSLCVLLFPHLPLPLQIQGLIFITSPLFLAIPLTPPLPLFFPQQFLGFIQPSLF